MYKAIFLNKLRLLLTSGVLKLRGIDAEKAIQAAGSKRWNVYAKSPFGNVASVVEYLGRYSHKVAITRHRILGITESEVRFRYKDYADGNKVKEMILGIPEFLRRFELHFLPRHFVKIRHYGLLQNQARTTRLNAIRKEMQLQPLPPKIRIPVSIRMLEQYGQDITLCPKCKKGRLILISIIYPVGLISIGLNPGRRIMRQCPAELPANKGSP